MGDRPNSSTRKQIALSAALLGSLWGLGGCASMDRQELTWQAMHAVDVAQTLNAASDPCYKEDAWLTSRLIGAQPSDGEVIAWGVGTAVFHAWVSRSLETRGAPVWVQMAWDLGTLGHTTYAVGTNHSEGVRPFGSNRDVEGCYY